jgi:hypothetical protein
MARNKVDDVATLRLQATTSKYNLYKARRVYKASQLVITIRRLKGHEASISGREAINIPNNI